MIKVGIYRHANIALNVLSDCLKIVSVQSESLRWFGNKFQTVGPATENDRRPSVLRRWRGTRRK